MRRVLFGAGIVLTGLLVVCSAGPAMAQAVQPMERVKCVERVATLKPPRISLPVRRAAEGRGQELTRARKLAPVCPEGQVPVTAFPTKRHFIKGNPMIGGYASPGPARVLPRGVVNHLLLPFDQVYWKRDRRPAEKGPGPAAGTGDPPCDGVPWFSSCFYYATASEQRLADGGGMTFQIEDPAVDNSGDAGGHSIGEIAVMNMGTAGTNLNDVEMGFSVSPDQFGDSHPHLFIYHWINGGETCYNTCGWNQYSNTYSPGMDLTQLVGQAVYIGWVHWQGAWWAWFNDQWLGYVADSEWKGGFTRTDQIQWYGEVASNNGIPPKTNMGDGLFPSQSTAAGMATLCDVDARAWVCWYRDQQSVGATRVNYYDILNHTNFGAVRYGGPGQ